MQIRNELAVQAVIWPAIKPSDLIFTGMQLNKHSAHKNTCLKVHVHQQKALEFVHSIITTSSSYSVWQFYWFQPQGPQDTASSHIKQSKTLA